MNMRFLKVLILCSLVSLGTKAQDVALKTNLLSDASANITLMGEVGLAPKWSFQVGGSFNAWTFDNNKRWKHWSAMPELRYWFCDHFGGHFVGVHAFGGQYNIGGINKLGFSLLGTDFSKLKDYRYQGWYIGGGVAYGYDWLLSKHWNLEAEIGLGYAYTCYDQFFCIGCGKKKTENQPHHYFGPTKAALSIVYVF